MLVREPRRVALMEQGGRAAFGSTTMCDCLCFDLVGAAMEAPIRCLLETLPSPKGRTRVQDQPVDWSGR